VDSGIYAEGDIDIYTNPITVRATGSNRPIMDGNSNNNDYAFAPRISGNIFQGLTMKNYDNALVDTTVNANAKSFFLTGCVGHFLAGPQYIGNTSTPAQSAEVRDCMILSEGHSAFYCGNGHVRFNNSVIASNAAGKAAVVSSTSYVNVTASFCTFIASSHANDSGRFYNVLNQVYKVINCIVSGSGDGINAYDSTYNLVQVSGDPFIQWGTDSYNGTARSANTGEITGDPLFYSGSTPGTVDPDVDGNVNLFTQDYGLRSGSPACGAGVAYGSITTDISGAARLSPPSIGAYECEAVAWSSYAAEPNSKFGSDFTINKIKNMSSNFKYKIGNSNRQVVFGASLPTRIRESAEPYKSNK
jgi:hypothetical protein